MGYPEFDEEISMMDRFMTKDPLETLEAVVTMEEIKYVQSEFVNVHISDEVKNT